jgi:hypothetical protein
LAQLGGSYCSSAVSSPRPQAGGGIGGGLSTAHHQQHAAGSLRAQTARHLASSSQQQPALPPAAAAAVVPLPKAAASQLHQPVMATSSSSKRSPDSSSSSPPARPDFSHSQIKALRKLFPIKQPTLKPAAALQVTGIDSAHAVLHLDARQLAARRQVPALRLTSLLAVAGLHPPGHNRPGGLWLGV